MYYHHLFNFIFIFIILPANIELYQIQNDFLILPKQAQPGFVLLEETRPSRSKEFQQCLSNKSQLDISIDEKYGDLMLNQTIDFLPLNKQELLCTINRNQV